MNIRFDFTIIGSGLAGLTSALVLREYGHVLLLSKTTLADCATDLAQGGICAVVKKEDSFESHIKDTLVAGANHNNKKAVEYMVRNAPEAIDWLVKQGVRFDRCNGDFAPTKEAAHSHNRVLHATDFTGQEIEKALLEKVKQEERITIWENCFALDLLVKRGKCLGVRVLRKSDLVLINIFSKAVVLATGGLGQIFKWTTNPKIATGDGLAMAARIGAKLIDLEFVQFHPTALKHGKSPLFLLSEALRGEGAYLKKVKSQKLKVKSVEGERFMQKYDPRGELAPRDIVARGIFAEQGKGRSVFLDIRHKGRAFLKKRFPNIYQEVKRRDFDLACDLVPVTPAVHYSCGGVKVDLYGRTNIENLFAFGEVACTGAHGANRLASNSLLEATVFPLRLGKSLSKLPKIVKEKSSREICCNGINHCSRSDFSRNRRGFGIRIGRISTNLKKNLQQLMWEKVGIVRKRAELRQALVQIKKWEKEIVGKKETNQDFVELKNMLLVAKLITTAALRRKKSLGAHFVT